ncbi:GNAT family N-acetyltransferase [Altibacter sp. HG106]|uniref:GNAT family N-acetyltransferase n=1 Tax=Altibacter sp. HG106 TaxID=3023937 RepID=UPI00235088B6|nr:GNAT family N-acetyltransferase [Altibacter sp. HG106]MDC7995680.1 GNAT family N-acetyltransferase [Altibacter sp. HG106]
MEVTQKLSSQDNDKLQCVKTNSAHPDFAPLVDKLNQELAARDGDEHAFYDQFNSIEHLQHVMVGYLEEEAICCGAFKIREDEQVEVKRMYTLPDYRGRGFGLKLLSELEAWAQSLGVEKVLLETGKRQPEAIRLYQKAGYRSIENYEPYVGVENSVCFEKLLKS